MQCRRRGFDPWVREIPWRRAWLPTPVFLPGEFHGQRSLAGYSPWGFISSCTFMATFNPLLEFTRASQLVLIVKNLPANTGDIRDTGSIPALGRSCGGGCGNSLQYSCPEDPRDRGPWGATVHGVTKSWNKILEIIYR